MQDPAQKHGKLTHEELALALDYEKKDFEKYYFWIEKHFSSDCFNALSHEELKLIVHRISTIHLNEYFDRIHLKNHAIVICLDQPKADVDILNIFKLYGIKTYQTHVSDVPFEKVSYHLRITIVYFTEFHEAPSSEVYSKEEIHHWFDIVKPMHHDLDLSQFSSFVQSISRRFLLSLSKESIQTTLDLFLRAQTRDHCQYHLTYTPSCHLILAWKNTPKYRFLFRLAKMIYRHGLTMNNVNITYVNAYSKNPILLLSLGLRTLHGKSPEKSPNMDDFIQELVTLKYFEDGDAVENALVEAKIVSGNEGNLLRTMISFIHQTLVHADANLYNPQNIEEAFCRHPELTSSILKLFEHKFHPEKHNLTTYQSQRDEITSLIQHLDTGQESNDIRRKNVFIQAINMMDHCLKTNYYRDNKSAFAFRLDPRYLNHLPYDRSSKFPEIPFGIFYIQGMHFLSFHIRFKDLARGGLRSVIPKKLEQMALERNNIFAECYNLAYTQQKKNKDIPEGGSKAVILLEPFERLHMEGDIYKNELQIAGVSQEEIQEKIELYQKGQRTEYLYQSQRAFIYSLITLTNCDEHHALRAKNIIDYYQRPEYIYLGPDENMYNEMIEWIANFSQTCHYPLGKAFITSKPSSGINHKEYGVTSLGVNVYMEEMLNYLDIDPKNDKFTIKMTGGPDGDVAGNELLNLYKHYPKTACLLALIDGSGTIYDPEGLDLAIVADLFHKGLPIAFYPPQKLHSGGFLLDTTKKKEDSLYSQKTLCSKNQDGKVIEEWLSGSEMNHLLRHNVHQTVTDIFIPGGGRPRTLNISNYKDFLDPTGKPTSKAIVEGANLYLTPEARRELEKLGVLIIKDSSANKGGVICSSLEVLLGLTVPEAEFIKNKPAIMKEVIHVIEQRARNEAKLLLKTYAETGIFLTDISDQISEKINTYTYAILDYLETEKLSLDEDDPFTRCLIHYCLPYIQKHHRKEILTKIPTPHQKAIIACYIASNLVYQRGIFWSPSIVDILPLISQNFDLNFVDEDFT